MKKTYSILFMLVLLSGACKKSAFNDLSGSATVQGVAMIYDTLNGVVIKKPYSNGKIYIRYPADTTGYIYGVNSNAAAQYVFNGIDLDSNYVMYARTDTGVIHYYGFFNLVPKKFIDGESDTLKLYPGYNQNGIHLIVRNETGEPLSNITGWVFNNLSLFNADSSSGRVFDIMTNPYGVGNVFNIPAGKYYIRAKFRINNTVLTGENTTINVLQNGITTAIVSLTKLQNGIELHTLDDNNTPLGGVTTYFYRSKTAFLLDSTYKNNVFALTSNTSGLSAIYNITPGDYYFRSVMYFAKDTLIYKGDIPITVDVSNVATRTVTVKK